MVDERGSWKRLRRMRFDSKALYKRAHKVETSTTKHAHKFVLSKLKNLRDIRQNILAWLVVVGILVGAVALQMYWYQQAYKTIAWKDGGTYAEAVLGPIDTLNPLYATTPAEQSASKLLFSSLYSYDDKGKLSDDLATSLSVSENGQEYIVKLRDDAEWSDGVNVTADDIVFTVNLMKSDQVRSVMYGNWTDVSAEVMDERTVKFTLPARYASFQHALTFAVLPRHILEDIPAGAIRQSAFSASPIGSGPFRLRLLQSSPDNSHKIANLSAATSYYGGAPRLARFELHGYETQDDMVTALQSGEVNAAAGTDMQKSAVPSSYKVTQYPVNSGVYALFNSDSAILKEKRVRQALQSGTDTAELRRVTGFDAPELYLPFVNGQLSGADIPEPIRFDVSKAQRLLDQAGWKLAAGSEIRRNSDGQELELRVITVRGSSYEKVLERLAGQWRKLGVKIMTEARDPASQEFVQATLQPRSYDVLLYKLAIGVDPDVYAYWHSSQATRLGFNFANYRSDIADDALASARSPDNPALRNEKYKDFSRQWLEDVPAIGLYQSVLQYANRPSVKPVIEKSGIPTDSDRYSSIEYWSAVQASVYKTP